jgi:hypothetical protein
VSLEVLRAFPALADEGRLEPTQKHPRAAIQSAFPLAAAAHSARRSEAQRINQEHNLLS